jgi:hypothetical protein
VKALRLTQINWLDRRLCARLRYAIGKSLYRVVLGTTVGRLPYASVRSIEEHAYVGWIRDRLQGCFPIYGPSIQTYDFPQALPCWFRKLKVFEGKTIFELTDVVVGPYSGLVWVPGEGIFEESIGSLLRMMGWGRVLWEVLISAKAYPTDRTVVPCPPVGYFHWLFEVLPNVIHAFNHNPATIVLLPPHRATYVDQSLQLVFCRNDLPVLLSNSPVRLKRVLLPQVEVFSGFIDQRDIALLRDCILSKVDDGPSVPKVYISRRRSGQRHMSSEDTVEEHLQSHGYAIVFLEDLAFIDQVRLFRGANTVAAPHGAGLSNLVWCSPGTRVLEIFPINYINDCYARLASCLGLTYCCLVAIADGTKWGKMPVDDLDRVV